MAKNILFDTGYWIALYDERDSYHEDALLISEFLAPHKMLIPWPTLYETLNTRFVRKKERLTSFKVLIENDSTILIDDEKYKNYAIKSVFSQPKTHIKYSLVDLVIREILLDVKVKIDALVTFNIDDFNDICLKRNIEILDG